ncbi:MAG: ABC transporter permease [Elusimicrobia bacterium]|nr:ABC transporter permease [Elusimicrobiota bacterium]
MRIFRKYWLMVWEMAVAEFRMKDQGTILGFLWTLIHPLIYFFVLYGLFRKWMGHHISNFPLYLIIGIVQWGFFCSGTTSCINVIRNNGQLIKSISFPKSILVFSSVTAVLFSHLLELGILLVFWLIIGENVGLTAIGLVPILILNIYLILGVSFILSVIGVVFLDIQRIWGIFTSVGLFLTPIFYSLDLLEPAKRKVILLNPMAHIIQATRDILIDNKVPEFGGILYVLIVATVIMAAGYTLFRRNEGYFVEKI